jgi:hypothetical protein
MMTRMRTLRRGARSHRVRKIAHDQCGRRMIRDAVTGVIIRAITGGIAA